jgi:large subunit ribosomal protein L2
MSVRKLKPITPGQRFRVVNGYDAITTDKPETLFDSADKKTLEVEIVKEGPLYGWWSQERYRIIDFKRTKEGIPSEINRI